MPVTVLLYLPKFVILVPVHRYLTALRFIILPLTQRIALGEGGIALFNTTHTWFATHSILQTALVTVLSFFTLCALYGYNDYVDRVVDSHNPKKNQKFVGEINSNPDMFIGLNMFLSLALIVCAFLILGWVQALCMFALLVINMLYSGAVKTIPYADILIVAVWGAAITLLVPVINPDITLVAGIMTGIAHIFQMLTDKDSDRASELTTTVVKYPQSTFWALGFYVLTLCITLEYTYYAWWLGVTALLPLMFYLFIRKNEVAWFFSRLYFAAIWLVLLWGLYGV